MRTINLDTDEYVETAKCKMSKGQILLGKNILSCTYNKLFNCKYMHCTHSNEIDLKMAEALLHHDSDSALEECKVNPPHCRKEKINSTLEKSTAISLKLSLV